MGRSTKSGLELENKGEDTESSFGINQVLILLALLLAGVAGYMTFKPVHAPTSESQQKTVPSVETESEVVEETPTAEPETSDVEEVTEEIQA